MFRIAICDDNTHICAEIELVLRTYAETGICEIETELFDSGERLIHFIKNVHAFDLIFLDIELGTTTGIAVGHQIRNELDDHNSKIVFITAKNGYEQRLFDVQPLNFLKKPINHKKMLECVDLAMKLLGIENTTFEYKKQHEIVKVYVKDILYLESQRKRIRIVTHQGEDYFYESLVNVKAKLPKTFMETHGSFLVNFDKVERVVKDVLVMMNGAEIPISQRNLKEIRRMLIEFERGKMNDKL